MCRLALAALALAAVAAATDDAERVNLLNIAYGGSVVSRTAELTLDQSALRPISGIPDSSWNSPPNDGKQQTIVYALPALSRIEKVGVKTPRAPLFHVASVQVDASSDGKQFAPLATIKLADTTDDLQLFPVDPPREMLYIRLTTIDTNAAFARIDSVQARGQMIRPIAQQPIDGCWSINGLNASFKRDRGRITGTIGGEHPISFEGGTDGAVYRFLWTSGPDYGFGAINTAPDGKHLSGLRWYVEPISYSAAESWFGEKSKCGAATPLQDVANRMMQQLKRMPLYGLHFDGNGNLDEAGSAATLDMLAAISRGGHFRLSSREFRMTNANANKQRAQQRLDSLRAAMQKRNIDITRFEWLNLADTNPPRAIESEIQRVLYGTIELQPL